MHYRLCDINLAVVAARSECFANCPDVTVSHGDIFAEPAQACARQMYYAYRTSHAGRSFIPADLMDACRNQFDLTAGQA